MVVGGSGDSGMVISHLFQQQQFVHGAVGGHHHF